MDVKNIASEIDLKINMLSGSPLYSDDIEINQIKLIDIIDFGYANYSRCLNLLTIDKKELVSDGEIINSSLFEIIITSGDQLLIKAFSDALCFFLNESVDDYYVVEGYGIAFGISNSETPISKIVTNDNFLDIVQILKYQNCLSNPSVKYARSNPANDKSRQVMERMQKAKEELEKAKSTKSSGDTENNIDFFDIISSVSTKSNTYNKSNVWDLTVYQLYDEYKRLEAIVGFETGVLALTQGAKIDLKHWSSKID